MDCMFLGERRYNLSIFVDGLFGRSWFGGFWYEFIMR